ncbi:glycosyltransferase family 2 protein [Enterococcus cecorum]|nr:glycosyltransferase family 2 protein [Enterococcus cecorum]
MKNNIWITVVTPTFNRGYILSELYESLCHQESFQSTFEWLIIDDSSIDDTENMVKKWIKDTCNFKIRYYKQNHGGKHRALNKAFDLAEGSYIIIVDSDDKLTSDALKKIYSWTKSIDDDSTFVGVSGLRITNFGEVLGGTVNFSKKYVDATGFEREKYNLLGDKAEVFRTAELKKKKFPEIDNETFITEEYCWMQFAAEGLKIRWYNEPIYICEYLNDGLTKSGANQVKGHIENFKGYCLYIQKSLELKPFLLSMMTFKEYNDTMKVIEEKYLYRSKNIGISPIKYLFFDIVCVPVARLINKINRWRYKRR